MVMQVSGRMKTSNYRNYKPFLHAEEVFDKCFTIWVMQINVLYKNLKIMYMCVYPHTMKELLRSKYF